MVKIAAADNATVLGGGIGSLYASDKSSHIFMLTHDSSDRHDLTAIFIAVLQCNDRIPDIGARQ